MKQTRRAFLRSAFGGAAALVAAPVLALAPEPLIDMTAPLTIDVGAGTLSGLLMAREQAIGRLNSFYLATARQHVEILGRVARDFWP